MVRKKGVIKQISNYGEKHPYVTLALAGTFGYYLYQNMTTVQAAAPLTDSGKPWHDGIYHDHIIREQMKMGNR